ncbi:hypothetical protein JW930_01540 [Candidatus Woesearchaeota archaeon]|nr:hypothetical protein [Candidatus Woesearchaeota archaeon]
MSLAQLLKRLEITEQGIRCYYSHNRRPKQISPDSDPVQYSVPVHFSPTCCGLSNPNSKALRRAELRRVIAETDSGEPAGLEATISGEPFSRQDEVRVILSACRASTIKKEEWRRVAAEIKQRDPRPYYEACFVYSGKIWPADFIKQFFIEMGEEQEEIFEIKEIIQEAGVIPGGSSIFLDYVRGTGGYFPLYLIQMKVRPYAGTPLDGQELVYALTNFIEQRLPDCALSNDEGATIYSDRSGSRIITDIAIAMGIVVTARQRELMRHEKAMEIAAGYVRSLTEEGKLPIMRYTNNFYQSRLPAEFFLTGALDFIIRQETLISRRFCISEMASSVGAQLPRLDCAETTGTAQQTLDELYRLARQAYTLIMQQLDSRADQINGRLASDFTDIQPYIEEKHYTVSGNKASPKPDIILMQCSVLALYELLNNTEFRMAAYNLYDKFRGQLVEKGYIIPRTPASQKMALEAVEYLAQQ